MSHGVSFCPLMSSYKHLKSSSMVLNGSARKDSVVNP